MHSVWMLYSRMSTQCVYIDFRCDGESINNHQWKQTVKHLIPAGVPSLFYPFSDTFPYCVVFISPPSLHFIRLKNKKKTHVSLLLFSFFSAFNTAVPLSLPTAAELFFS